MAANDENDKENLPTKSGVENERRISSSDRRSFQPGVNFPFKDSYGTVVLRDRRTKPDRRLSNYEIITAEMDAEEFQAYMDGYQWKL